MQGTVFSLALEEPMKTRADLESSLEALKGQEQCIDREIETWSRRGMETRAQIKVLAKLIAALQEGQEILSGDIRPEEEEW